MPAQRFGDDQAIEFRAEVRAWLHAVRPSSWETRLSEDLTPASLIEARREWDLLLSQGGFAGLSWPKEYGGRGLGAIEEFIFAEEAAAVGAPDSLNFIGYGLAGPALIEFGTPEQQHRYLRPILQGEEIWCEGFSEPDAGSDMAAISTKAVRCDGGWQVWGQKIWTSVADLADMCYLLVKSSADLGRRKNLSVLLLAMDQPAVRTQPIRQATGEYEFSEVFFDGAFVPDSDLLGTENDGWRLGTLAGFRQGKGVKDAHRRYVLIRAAMDTLLSCARDTGRPEPWRLNREVVLLRWHILRATEVLAGGGDVRGLSSSMRLVWAPLWQRIASEGLDCGCPAHEAYWRREFLFSKSLTIAGGTSQIQRNVLANTVLGLPRG